MDRSGLGQKASERWGLKAKTTSTKLVWRRWKSTFFSLLDEWLDPLLVEYDMLKRSLCSCMKVDTLVGFDMVIGSSLLSRWWYYCTLFSLIMTYPLACWSLMLIFPHEYWFLHVDDDTLSWILISCKMASIRWWYSWS